MISSVLNKKGFVLVFALCFITLIVLICVAYSLAAANSLTISARITDSMRAYYIADAGLTHAFVSLRGDYAIAPESSFEVSNNNYLVGNRSGSYHVDVAPVPGEALPTYTITSTGTYPINGVSRTLELTVRASPITTFIYFSTIEVDPSSNEQYWGTGNFMTGRVHTNGHLHIFGFPVFEGPVSQHDPAVQYFIWAPLGTVDDIFRGGLTLGAPIVSMPDLTLFTGQIKAAAGQNNGSNPYHLSGDTSITLYVTGGAGNMLIVNAGRADLNGVALPIPPNHAIFVEDGTVTVHGRLKGSLTIGCDDDIIVNDSIIYDTDPRLVPSSTDMLGLVTGGSVVLANPTLYEIANPLVPDADVNIEIDASIVALNALNGCFELEGWDSFLKGDLIMFGSLACQFYGPNGEFDWSGNLVHGYYQQQIYDERLETVPPPCYQPVTEGDGRIIYDRTNFTESL